MNTPADASDTAINRLFELEHDQNSSPHREECVTPAAETSPADRFVVCSLPDDLMTRNAFANLSRAVAAKLSQ